MIELAPSILSVDFARLGAEAQAVVQGGASVLHDPGAYLFLTNSEPARTVPLGISIACPYGASILLALFI